jgi:hypothetical protein
VLVTLPLVLDLQPRPLIRIERLQGWPSEPAVRRGLRCEKGRIWPADRGFLRSERACAGAACAVSGEAPGAQAASEASNASATARRHAIRGAIAILSGIAWSGLIVTGAPGGRMEPWRLGRRPGGAIMADKAESNFKN